MTAPLFAPLLAVAAAAVALALPAVRRHLLLGAAALAAAPLAVGILTVLVTPGGPVAEESFPTSEAVGWSRVLGDDPVVTGLLVAGVLLGSLLVRRGAARGLAVASALLVFLGTAPGVYELFEAVTGAGPVGPRLMLVAPFAVLVGMLATATLPAGRPGSRLARVLPPSSREHAGTAAGVLVLALLVAFGTPVWSHQLRASITDRPRWKVDQRALADVRAVLAEDPGPGPVLLPARAMRVLAITTTRTFGAVPRTFYVPLLQEPEEEHSQRVALRRFVDSKREDPTDARLAAALEGLGVTLACADRRNHQHVEALASTGYVDQRRVGGMVCFDRPS